MPEPTSELFRAEALAERESARERPPEPLLGAPRWTGPAYLILLVSVALAALAACLVTVEVRGRAAPRRERLAAILVPALGRLLPPAR